MLMKREYVTKSLLIMKCVTYYTSIEIRTKKYELCVTFVDLDCAYPLIAFPGMKFPDTRRPQQQ